jgi:hypothetical protein
MATTKVDPEILKKHEPSTYLIQRLQIPFKEEGRAFTKSGVPVDEIFSFGGGGSGLKPEAWKILAPLWRFDYMGAAEFEFGAFPRSFGPFMQSDPKTYSFTIKATDYGDGYARAYRKKNAPKLPDKIDRDIFLICTPELRDYAEAVIRDLASKNPKTRLKEATRLLEALDPVETTYPSDVVGWYELDNGFLFFTDREMFDRVVTALDLTPGESP